MRFCGRRYAVALAGLTLLVGGTLLGRALLQREAQPLPSAPISRGSVLYQTHCAVCHGRGGKGDGPGATVIRQPMRDFSSPTAMREVNDRFLFEIIKKGSSQFGRSNAMPAWGMKLSDDDIHAVVAHIRSLASGTPAGPGARKDTP